MTVRNKIADQDDQDREIIRVAKNLMAPIATAPLYRALGLRYGMEGFDEALNLASRKQLDTLVTHCRHYVPDEEGFGS